MRMRAAKGALALFAVVSLVGVAGAASAIGANQSHLVTATPSTKTPNINDGTVYAITQVGSRIIVGGSFTNADPPGDTKSSDAVTRDYILAFDQSTGQIDTAFVPALDGTVRALQPGPTPDTVYVGGEFNTVNGSTAKSVALLNLNNGRMVTGFKPASMNGIVWALQQTHGQLIIGGTFTTLSGVSHEGLGSLNPTTGALTNYLTIQVTGHHNYTGQPGQADGGVGVHKLDVSPDGTKLVAAGNFKMADGVVHDQILLADLTSTSGSLDTGWNTAGYTATCASNAYDTYMRDVAFSPDGSYFVVAVTGGGTFDQNTDGTRALCDTATRWNITDTGADVQPVWIDYTGNDSFESITTTGTAIYVGGHQRWVNNANASDSAGPGSVPRPGVAALDPQNGMPYSWNPGRNPRGAGAYALLATSTGLYVGSDTDQIGSPDVQVHRGRIAYFPLDGGESVPAYTPPTLPANVFLAGQLPNGQNTNVLYRVDTGGPTLPAVDNGPDWQGDTSDPSPYRDNGTNTAGYSAVPNVDSSVPSSTPHGIFDTERWGESHWSFPVTPGTPIEVRLFFANRYTGTSQVGQRVFDVSLDGSTVLDHYDIVAGAGDQTGTMKKFDLTAPASGQVTVNLAHETENPLINGIEIVRTDQAPPPSGAFDTLQSRTFDGTTVGGTAAVDSGTIAWSQVRGAFMAGNELFYGYSDGNLYEVPFDGATLGSPTVVDPYDDPAWANVDTKSGQTYRGVKPGLYGSTMQNVTGFALADGKLYYATAGSARLHYRYFEPDDGVVGSVEFTAGGTADLSNIKGMFVTGDTLYYAAGSDGDLHAVDFDHGAPDASTDTVVSGPGVDGNDWRSRGLFALPEPAPTASFVASCTGLSCSFDGSGSTAPGSTITSYSWDFGDGHTDTGATTSHTYAAGGTYTVKLTVKNALGGSASTSQQVAPSQGAAPIGYRGGDSADGNATTETVTVPNSVQQGDGMLLIATGANAATLTAPSGWTLVGTSPATTTTITTAVWRRVATGSDAGTNVSVGFGAVIHGTVQLVAYSGTDSSNPVAGFGVNTGANSTSLTTPTASVTAGGSWVVSYWAAKSSTVTGWSAPSGQVSRGAENGSGSGRINSVVVDSGAAVPTGPAGGLTGNTDQAYGAADSWTIILKS
jgi:PKD repeat protein